MSKNTDPTILQGNLTTVLEPKTLSLVGLPANQRGFKVVRSDKGSTDAVDDGADSKGEAAAPRRVRRSAQNPILRLAFAEMSTDDMNEILTLYGMEDYSISAEDGIVVATRSDLQSFAIEGTETIKLQEGVTAYVARQAKTVKRGDERKQLKVAAFEFDAARFDAASAQAWLSAKAIEVDLTLPAGDVTSFVAKRSAVAEGVEARRMEIEEGVIAVIVLDSELDVPAGVIEVIAEAAYGNWGWGQLDFNARLADRAFCDAMSDAVWILRDTLDSLIFYSDLPLDVRQQLITNALTQFNAYVTTMMSALPRQVLVAVARSDRKEKSVSTQNTPAAQEAAVVRNDNENAPAVAEGAAVDTSTASVTAASADTTGTPETFTLSQADIDARVNAEIARRAEAATAATATAEPTVKDLLQRMDAMQATNTEMAAQIAALAKPAEPVVVVRSDTAGDESRSNVTAPTEVKRGDVFQGVITRLRASR